MSDLPSAPPRPLTPKPQSYLREIRKRTDAELREYVWRDLAIAAAGAIGYALIFAGWTVGGLVQGALAFAVLFVAAYAIHFLRAASALYAKHGEDALAIKDELDEIRRHKLFLVVDTELHLTNNWEQHYSGVFIGERVDNAQAIERYEKQSRIKANLFVFFDNRDATPARVESVGVSLIAGDDMIPLEVWPNLNGHHSPITDLEVGPRKKLGEYWLDCDAIIGLTLIDLTTTAAYLRVVMMAVGQDPYCVDISTDWDKAWYPDERAAHIEIRRAGAC